MTSGDASKPAPTSRLLEIDALRGIAALSVVLFHYTTRFTELYGRQHAASLSFPDGHYGVNLFFVISGFVIFMTLEKTSRPMDFVVSRFSRLFPVYWAAIFITLSITHALGLPDKLVGIGTALANMLMIHGLFRVPHVDGVYWTLKVELLWTRDWESLDEVREAVREWLLSDNHERPHQVLDWKTPNETRRKNLGRERLAA